MKSVIRKINQSRRIIHKDGLRRVLFVKLFAIGDCLNATPALRALRKGLPEVRIDVLVGSWSHQVFLNNSRLDRLITAEDGWFRKPNLPALGRLIYSLRREHYDAALLFHRDLRLGALLTATGIPIRVGLDLEGDGVWLTHPVLEAGVRHEIDIYNSLLTPLGIEPDGTDMEIFPDDQEKERAETLWRECRLGEPVIGLTPGGASNPGETMPQRIWPHYGKLAELILKSGGSVAYFGGSSDLASLEHLPQGERAASFIGKGSLGVTAELMRRCNLVVTHDSGPMHLAAAAGIPTISLFAPTDPRRKAPLGGQHRCLAADLPCAPCYHRGRWPEECSQECLGTIHPESVMELVKQVLKNCDSPRQPV